MSWSPEHPASSELLSNSAIYVSAAIVLDFAVQLQLVLGDRTGRHVKPMLQLTSERLINAWDKAVRERPWCVKIRERRAGRFAPATITYKVTPKSGKRSGAETFQERLKRQFYFVTIEIRHGKLFGECRDRDGELCPAHYFGNICFHVAAVVRRLEMNARKAA